MLPLPLPIAPPAGPRLDFLNELLKGVKTNPADPGTRGCSGHYYRLATQWVAIGYGRVIGRRVPGSAGLRACSEYIVVKVLRSIVVSEKQKRQHKQQQTKSTPHQSVARRERRRSTAREEQREADLDHRQCGVAVLVDLDLGRIVLAAIMAHFGGAARVQQLAAAVRASLRRHELADGR